MNYLDLNKRNEAVAKAGELIWQFLVFLGLLVIGALTAGAHY